MEIVDPIIKPGKIAGSADLFSQGYQFTERGEKILNVLIRGFDAVFDQLVDRDMTAVEFLHDASRSGAGLSAECPPSPVFPEQVHISGNSGVLKILPVRLADHPSCLRKSGEVGCDGSGSPVNGHHAFASIAKCIR